jgi:hypothetical protein
VNDLLAKGSDITALQTFIDTIYMGQLLVKIYIKYGSGLPSTPQPMRYVRGPDAITAAWKW